MQKYESVDYAPEWRIVPSDKPNGPKIYYWNTATSQTSWQAPPRPVDKIESVQEDKQGEPRIENKDNEGKPYVELQNTNKPLVRGKHPIKTEDHDYQKNQKHDHKEEEHKDDKKKQDHKDEKSPKKHDHKNSKHVEGHPDWIELAKMKGTEVKEIYWWNEKTHETTHIHPSQHSNKDKQDSAIELSQDALHQVKICREFLAKQQVTLVINDKHGVIGKYCGEITAEPCNSHELLAYIPLFMKNFVIYDEQIHKQSHLSTIVFARQVAWSGQKRAAIPTYAIGLLYYDINFHDPYGENVLHHEYYHQMDYGIWGNKVNTGPDSEWNKCNPEGFTYGSNLTSIQPTEATKGMKGGALMRDANTAYQQFTGFCNNYSATAQEEDKAETWSHMILSKNFHHNCQYLCSKIEYMKQLMVKHYPTIDKAFWERASVLQK